MNEIWDFIAEADKKRQIIGSIRSKEQQINNLPKVCGSCELWMTSQCVREKTKKVSNSMPVCGDFKQQKWVSDLINELKSEVLELRTVLNSLK